MSLTKVSYSMIDGAATNVLDYGADPTGVADSTTAIQDALNAVSSAGGGSVYIPKGVYKTTASIEINGNAVVFGDGIASTIIEAAASVLEAVKIGATTIFAGAIRDITVRRAAYSGATENIGWAFYNCSGCLFENIESRFSKYNIFTKPGSGQRVAYSTFINAQCVGGLYNISGAPTGTGFANELVFYGGRMFTTADTDTNVYLDFGCNHWRFGEMSCEGAGSQAFFFNAPVLGGSHSHTVENCRTEGTWSVDDVVLGANTQRCLVVGVNLYTTVTDNGLGNTKILSTGASFGTNDNAFTAVTVNRTGAPTGVAALKINDTFSSSGNSYGIEIRSGRDTASGYIIRGLRDSDNLERFSVTSNGILTTGISLRSLQSAWNFEPLKLGNYTLWVNSTGDLMIKNGVPANDADGTVVGTQT